MKKFSKAVLMTLTTIAATAALTACEQANACNYDEAAHKLACVEKTYKTANIGGKIWMTDNLVRHDITGKSYCYGDIPANCENYGSLYPFETALKICPDGWELPTQADFENANVASEEFKTLKVGFRYYDGKYADEDVSASFWTKDAFDDARAVMIRLDTAIHTEHFNKTIAASVRCIKK